MRHLVTFASHILTVQPVACVCFLTLKTPLNVLFFCNSTVIKRNLKHTPYTLSDTEKRLNRIAKEKWEKKNRVQKMVDERREEWEGNVRSGLLSS